MVVRSAQIFIDTNILVYQFDKSSPAKQQKAIKVISDGLVGENIVISTQVVQEFINVALKKFKRLVTPKEMVLFFDTILEPLCVHTPDISYYKRTLSLFEKHSLSWYDALIVQAAIDTKCQIIYSEDLQDGQKFGKLTIKNPFV